MQKRDVVKTGVQAYLAATMRHLFIFMRIAQCYRELGYKKESGESLQEAARFSQNTIFSDDGPSLQREIKRAQQALQ